MLATARTWVLVAATVLLAVSGCGASGPTSSAPDTARPQAIGHLHTSVVPAGMVDPLRFGYPPSDAVMFPIVNAWAVADHRTEVDVYAGAVSPVQGRRDRGDGLFVINSYSFLPLRQTQKHVVVSGAGALRIIRAPQGLGVVTSAQRDGNLRFMSARGIHGTLHLATDTVTIRH